MLITIGIIFVVLWALGFIAFHVTGWFIHIALLIGIVAVVAHFFKKS